MFIFSKCGLKINSKFYENQNQNILILSKIKNIFNRFLFHFLVLNRGVGQGQYLQQSDLELLTFIESLHDIENNSLKNISNYLEGS